MQSPVNVCIRAVCQRTAMVACIVASHRKTHDIILERILRRVLRVFISAMRYVEKPVSKSGIQSFLETNPAANHISMLMIADTGRDNELSATLFWKCFNFKDPVLCQNGNTCP